ncbi:response regulator [Pseudomonas sp. UBA6562]|uniref:response regulator n=1 Tax=Pseudomonas sp. UBA6562 TaxID=1947332 RepID=UPI0039C8E43E
MKRVLIVEDEPMLLELLVTIIDEMGFTTTTAATVDDGIELLGAHAWAMVVTDVRTPGRSDGWDLAWTAHHQWPSLAVIVTSGGNAHFGKPLPSSAVFLAKPWSIEQMTSLVRSRAGGFASSP